MDRMITTAIVAFCTLVALAPPRRPLAPGAASFLCSFALNELPFAYLLSSTSLSLDQNDSDTPVTWAVISLAALTAGGLVVVAWRGLRAAQRSAGPWRRGWGLGGAPPWTRRGRPAAPPPPGSCSGRSSITARRWHAT
jgi:hypothetical protein